MANITKRANKRCVDHLDGEVAELALLCEMRGGLGVGMVAAVVATRTTERVMKGRTGERLDEQGGAASLFPASTAAVLVTPTRFMAMASNGIRFRPPSLVVPRGHVRADLVGRKGFGKRLEFVFTDGTRATVDVGPGQPLDRFVEALNR